MQISNSKTIKSLKKYFEKQPSVLLAFLFGSYARGFVKEESDLDIGVYLKNKVEENMIRRKTGELAEKEVDLVLLDEAPASLASHILKTGIPLAIKDRRLYWQLYLKATLEAEDFLHFARDYWEIYKRSKSLTTEDEERVLQRWQFLDSEFQEIEEFKKLTFQEYCNDGDKRKIIERWVEIIINATIDIAKIILAAEQREMPRSYKDALYFFGAMAGLNQEESDEFAEFAELRNIIAHEYLEVLYDKIQEFIKEFPPLYEKISGFLEQYLKK